MGLRERKKTQTRQHIAEVAWRLFADHGFDQVTAAFRRFLLPAGGLLAQADAATPGPWNACGP